MMNNYVVYHLHDFTSNCNGYMDSTTDYKKYVELAKKNGMSALAFSNHGGIYDWIKKKQLCDKAGIKYIHGVEAYMCERLELNQRGFHIGLYAKNLDGVKEINTLVSKSFDKGVKDDKTDRQFYFNPRLSINQIKNTSENIIITSACLASIFWKMRDSEVVKDLLEWMSKHSNRCFLEIQYHQCEDQIEYNKLLYNWSLEYNIPLIAGTDTHSATQYDAECRLILQKSKNMNYADDDEKEFDLIFKNYDDLRAKFKEQDSLPEDVIFKAIQNTNVLADMVEEFELNYDFKYPALYGDNGLQTWKRMIFDKMNDKFRHNIIDITEKDAYIERLREEINAMEKQGMQDFMLFMAELVEYCNDNDIPYGFCRGSIGGSLVAYITDIIDVNPMVWHTVFSRFCNADRISLADIDIDFAPEDREKVYEYIIKRFGKDKTAYILTLGTVKDRGAIDVLAKGLDYDDLDLVKDIKNSFDNIFANYSKIVQEEVDIDTLVEEKILDSKSVDFDYHDIYMQRINVQSKKEKLDELWREFETIKVNNRDLFYYFDGLKGCVISKGHHPAGMIGSPITLYDNLSVNYKNGDTNFPIANCTMKAVDSLNYVKFDILGLKNVGILKDTYKYIGSHYLKSYEIDWNDQDVWADMIKHRAGVFQFEGEYAFDLLQKFTPQRINDMSLVNASLRPSGKSYRNRLINHEFNNNPSEQIDNLLEQNNGFLVFQEDTIKFLTDICGFSGSKADSVRRAIGKKDTEALNKQLPEILEGYCNTSNKPRDIAETEAKEFVQIVQDSSEYQFGYNHSTGYSMIGYALARLRHYYPLEFTTAYLNRAKDEEHRVLGMKLADTLGISVSPVKFQYSGSDFTYDKETNTIYQGIAAIKDCSARVARSLYDLRFNKYNSFLEALPDLISHGINKTNIEVLTRLDYFSAFGKVKTLLKQYELYQKYNDRKTITKGAEDPWIENIVKKHSSETEKQYRALNMPVIMGEIYEHIPDEDLTIKEKIEYEIEYMGYVITRVDTLKQNCMVLNKDIKYTPKLNLMSLKTGTIVMVKLDKSLNHHLLQKGDLIRVESMKEKHGWYKNKEGKWITDLKKKVWWLEKYTKIGEDLL